MFILKLVHLYSGITRVFEDMCYDTVHAAIRDLPRREDGYDSAFELLPETYDPDLWEVRFNKVERTASGLATIEIDDFRPLAEDR